MQSLGEIAAHETAAQENKVMESFTEMSVDWN